MLTLKTKRRKTTVTHKRIRWAVEQAEKIFKALMEVEEIEAKRKRKNI